MPNPSNNPEAVAIEAAYQAQVQTLFRSLITNLGDQVVSHQSDQQSLDKFKVGLNIAKRARQLALNVVVPAWLQDLPDHEAKHAKKNNPDVGASHRQRTNATQACSPHRFWSLEPIKAAAVMFNVHKNLNEAAVRHGAELRPLSGVATCCVLGHKESPAVAGLSVRRNVEPENRTCGYRWTDSRLALP
jgi:hypothetical protein